MPGRGHRLAPLVFALIACVWLNQSVPLETWRAMQTRVWVTQDAGWFETLRYPFVFLYRRSGDEQMYHALARSMRGEEPDRVFMRAARRRSGPDFERELPAADGHFHAPYTEVPFEYPPAAVPLVLLPSLLGTALQPYCVAFGVVMGLLLTLASWLVHRALRWDEARSTRAWWLGTAALLLHGSIAVQRLDAAVALALAAGLFAWSRGHLARMGAAFGAAGALKLTPALLLVAIAGLSARPRRVIVGALGVMGFGMGAFGLFGAGALGSFVRYHAARGLHCESVAATALAVVRAPFSPLAAATFSYGSLNLEDQVADVLARVLTPVMPLCLVALGVWAKRRARPTTAAHAAVVVAALCVVWLTGKVFSPQYLTWLLPFVGVLRTRTRSGATLTSAAACAAVVLLLSQVYMRAYFDAVYAMTALGVGTLLVRDVALALLLVRCMQSASSARAPAPA